MMEGDVGYQPCITCIHVFNKCICVCVISYMYLEHMCFHVEITNTYEGEHVYMYVCMYACMCVCVCVCVCMYVCMYV